MADEEPDFHDIRRAKAFVAHMIASGEKFKDPEWVENELAAIMRGDPMKPRKGTDYVAVPAALLERTAEGLKADPKANAALIAEVDAAALKKR